MKKLIVTGLFAIAVIIAFSSCGNSRKLGCPSVAIENTDVKTSIA